jgi:DNA-binding NarL/FixJ family response regulator
MKSTLLATVGSRCLLATCCRSFPPGPPEEDNGGMDSAQLTIVYGEEELFARTAHLFASARDVACAANDLHTWAATRQRSRADRPTEQRGAGMGIRKLYRPGVLLDPSSAQHVREVEWAGARIRITGDEVNKTIILDHRIAILAGELADGRRSYSVLSEPGVVQAVTSLFEAAWRAATDLRTYNARHAELYVLAPRVLELLDSGCKDETAARTLGLGVRTYRRRVAELMDVLGAESRFQAGARARELGLV